MGLDMYLTAERFIWYNEQDLAQKVAELFPELADSRGKVEKVIVEAIYWRKANHIHAWFVENVQEGNDDWGTYYVSRDKLKELRDLLIEVCEKPELAVDKLPTRSGFFFGSTEYDEGYYADNQRTIEMINIVLEKYPKQWDFYYHSSW